MDIEQLLREGLKLQDPGAEFSARVMAQVGQGQASGREAVASLADARQRRRSRLIFLGTITAVVAAAAMLVGQLTDVPLPAAAVGTAQDDVPRPPPAIEPMEEVRDVREEVVADDHSARIGAVPVVAAGPPADAGNRTILIKPLRHQSDDPAAEAPAGLFRAAFIEELRKIPGLVLVEPDSRDTAPQAAYTLTVSTLRVRILTSGTREVLKTDGSSSSSSGGTARVEESWPVEVRVEESVQAPGQRQQRHLQITPEIDSAGYLASTGCGRGGQLGATPGLAGIADMRALLTACSSIAGLAAAVANALNQPLQVPGAVRDQLQSQARDESLRLEERFRAVTQLITSAMGRGAPAIDAESIAAIFTELGEFTPERRIQALRMLRSVDHPGLVEPLIGLLRNDEDERVRLEAMLALARRHASDVRVSTTLASVARDDPREIVRMAARRLSGGDSEWNQYMTATLRNASLPFTERVLPLIYVPHLIGVSPLRDDQANDFTALLQGEEMTRLLVGLIREGRANPLQIESVRSLLGLVSVSRHPSVLELQIELLQERAGRGATELATSAASGLLTRANEPEVRKILEEVVAGKGEPFVRDMIEQRLMQMDSARVR